MKTVRVVAAVIKDNSRILATQRGSGDFKGGWEFPGGKIESGETPEAALVREIREELSVTVIPERLIGTVEYDYPTFHLSMDCFLCTLEQWSPVLSEHSAFRWLTKDEIHTPDWLPADILILEKVKELF